MFELMPFKSQKNELVRKPAGSLWDNLWSEFMGLEDVSFKTDVKETEQQYIIQAELPGIKRENIVVEAEDNYLTISVVYEESQEEKKENYIRKERRTGSFQRSFWFDNVDVGQIKANYHEGLLEVSLPKLVSDKPGRKKIDIE